MPGTEGREETQMFEQQQIEGTVGRNAGYLFDSIIPSKISEDRRKMLMITTILLNTELFLTFDARALLH